MSWLIVTGLTGRIIVTPTDPVHVVCGTAASHGIPSEVGAVRPLAGEEGRGKEQADSCFGFHSGAIFIGAGSTHRPPELRDGS